MELGAVIKQAVDSKNIEPLLRKMALIIDRQAIALGSLEFNMNSIHTASKCHESLFEDLKKLAGGNNGSSIDEVRPDSASKG